MPATRVQLSYVSDHTHDAFYSNNVTTLQLQLPVSLRCHVTVLSANHIEPDITVSFDDVDMTSQFVRSMTSSTRSSDGGWLTATDYVTELEWSLTLKELLDLHTSNWSCYAAMPYYPPLVTSSLIYVTRMLYSSTRRIGIGCLKR